MIADIILLFVVIIIIVAVIMIMILLRKFSQKTDLPPSNYSYHEEYENDFSTKEDFNENKEFHKSSSNQGDFDSIIQSIEKNYMPKPVITEEKSEEELISFLNSKYPNNIQRRGHTTEGKRIDIVIDGTIALELVIVETEGKLVLLMEHVLNSVKDFGKVAIILIDIGKVPASTIDAYVRDYANIGVKTINKKVKNQL